MIEAGRLTGEERARQLDREAAAAPTLAEAQILAERADSPRRPILGRNSVPVPFLRN